MSAIQIPDELRQVIDRQVAEGRAASAAEFLEAAVRRYALELEADDAEMAAAAEQGLAALRRGDHTTLDGPHTRHSFWEDVSREAAVRLAEFRAATADSDTGDHALGTPGPRE